MIENKPSIYNAPSVYNQGGALSSVDVDINGVVNTIVFPPYLVPVEFVDMSNYTGLKTFRILNTEQIPIAANANNLFVKMVIQTSYEKATDDPQKPINYLEPFTNGTNNEIRANIRKLSNGDGYIEIVYGLASPYFTPVDLSKKLELIIDAKNDSFKVKEIGGTTKTSINGSTKPAVNIGRLITFQSHNVNAFFYGRIFYSYILNSVTKEIYSLVIPARAKDPNDTKPYMVECVSGSVGCNYSSDLTTGGIEFGPDIDLSEIQNYFT